MGVGHVISHNRGVWTDLLNTDYQKMTTVHINCIALIMQLQLTLRDCQQWNRCFVCFG